MLFGECLSSLQLGRQMWEEAFLLGSLIHLYDWNDGSLDRVPQIPLALQGLQGSAGNRVWCFGHYVYKLAQLHPEKLLLGCPKSYRRCKWFCESWCFSEGTEGKQDGATCLAASATAGRSSSSCPRMGAKHLDQREVFCGCCWPSGLHQPGWVHMW